MGTIGPHQSHQFPPLNPLQWKQVQQNVHKHKISHGHYISLQHLNTKIQIDKYQLQFFNKKQQQIYYHSYLKRQKQQYIVNTIYYHKINIKQFCSHIYQSQIYIQHIPLRLADITDIPYPDNLYLLRNSLLGFALLYQIFGYFQVQEDHICINNYGEVKVWLHTNLSKNIPQQLQNNNKSQCDMVNKIIHLIQINTNLQQSLNSISQYFIKHHKNYPNFSQASQLLTQYLSTYNIHLSKRCESILSIFSHKQKISHHPKSNLPTQQNKSIKINNIKLPKLPLDKNPIKTHQSKHYNNNNHSYQTSRNSLSSQKKLSNKINSLQNSQINQSPTIDLVSSKYQQPRTTYISSLLNSQRLPQNQIFNVSKTITTKHNNRHLNLSNNQSKNKNNNKFINYNKLSIKQSPLKSPHHHSLHTSITPQKPLITFIYQNTIKQLKPTSSLSRQKAHIIPKIINKKKKLNKKSQQKYNAMQNIQLCYYTAGIEPQSIDPEIAADLLQYL